MITKYNRANQLRYSFGFGCFLFKKSHNIMKLLNWKLIKSCKVHVSSLVKNLLRYGKFFQSMKKRNKKFLENYVLWNLKLYQNWFVLVQSYIKIRFYKKRKIVFFNFLYNNCHIIKRGTIVAIQLELKKIGTKLTHFEISFKKHYYVS